MDREGRTFVRTYEDGDWTPLRCDTCDVACRSERMDGFYEEGVACRLPDIGRKGAE